jgi:hypothetical protein
MNRLIFQQLAETRLLDAKALFLAGRFSAAYYMAGYVIECALKACIARKTREYDFPERDANRYYVHNLKKLFEAADLVGFRQDLKADSTLAGYWSLVTRWNEESRYQPRGTEAEKLANDMLLAVTDEEHGVLRCLSKYW